MSELDHAFSAISEYKTWLNIQSGVPLTLADISELIPNRWSYFRDSWEFILPVVRERAITVNNPAEAAKQIESMSNLIRIQRQAVSQRSNPFQKSNILNDYYFIWENTLVNSVPLTKEEENILQEKVKRISRFIRTDFTRIRQDIVNGRDEIADTTGLNDSSYDATYYRGSAGKNRDATIADIENMQILQSVISSLDQILANTASLATTSVDPFALARANANNPDITINTGYSGVMVRMNYGEDLQALASRFLGDSERWMEIAIANGLKPPYIDEIGESINLISNGNGNQINIAKLDVNGKLNEEKIYINQIIFIQSNTFKFSSQRRILNIKQIPISGELVIELDGESNLSQYTVLDSANIRVFKPNTLNSNFMVMLPSPTPATNPPTKETPFFLSAKGEDEKRAGVDLLLSEDRDLVFSASGDLQLSYGIANSVQAMQLKLEAEQGQNPRHPTYGLQSIAGDLMSNKSAIQQALTTGITGLVAADSRFSRVENLNISFGQGYAIISMDVRMAGTGTLLPLNFTINTG